MKVGDLIKFKATGVIGTITETTSDVHDTVFVLAHGADPDLPNYSTCFRGEYLKEVAEIISIS